MPELARGDLVTVARRLPHSHRRALRPGALARVEIAPDADDDHATITAYGVAWRVPARELARVGYRHLADDDDD